MERIRRILQAAYHPRNYYVLHLDLQASDFERLEVAKFVKTERVVGKYGNVMVIGKADLVTYKDPTMIASTLHAVAILLKRGVDWDWYQRAIPIIIDPGLYHSKKSGVFWAKEKRALRASFKLFIVSEWVVLTKSFLVFCIWGWDNLPRTLLMYYTNFLSSPEGYFHTVVCNHKDFQNTTFNHDLHYLKWDNPPKQDPISLTLENFEEMVESGAPFARKFAKHDPVLDKIDRQLLRRPDGRFTPGGWCLESSASAKDPCVIIGSPDAVKRTVNSKRLEKLFVKLLDSENFRSKQCK